MPAFTACFALWAAAFASLYPVNAKALVCSAALLPSQHRRPEVVHRPYQIGLCEQPSRIRIAIAIHGHSYRTTSGNGTGKSTSSSKSKSKRISTSRVRVKVEYQYVPAQIVIVVAEVRIRVIVLGIVMIPGLLRVIVNTWLNLAELELPPLPSATDIKTSLN